MRMTMTLILAAAFSTLGCNENNTARLDDGGETNASTPFDSINSLIKSSPNSSDLYFERAKLHYSKRDLASSLSDVGRALKLDSTETEYYLLLADLKLIAKESRASRDALLEAHKRDPENIDVLIKLGELYMIVRDAENSFKYLNKALKLDVYNASAYRIKGFNYKFAGDTVNAISSFQTAVEQDPDDYDSWMQLGLLFAEGDQDLALDYYNNAINLRPNSLEARYAKGVFLQNHEQPRQAIQAYEKIVEMQPKYFDAWYNMGYVHLDMYGNYDSAAYFFNQAISNGPDGYFSAIYNRGLSKELAGDLKAAEADYKQALEINPQYDLAAKGLSRIKEKRQ